MPPPIELIGVAQQCEHAVADQVHRGLVARDVQQDDEREQLLGREPVAFLLGDDEPRQHVAAEVPAT